MGTMGASLAVGGGTAQCDNGGDAKPETGRDAYDETSVETAHLDLLPRLSLLVPCVITAAAGWGTWEEP